MRLHDYIWRDGDLFTPLSNSFISSTCLIPHLSDENRLGPERVRHSEVDTLPTVSPPPPTATTTHPDLPFYPTGDGGGYFTLGPPSELDIVNGGVVGYGHLELGRAGYRDSELGNLPDLGGIKMAPLLPNTSVVPETALKQTPLAFRSQLCWQIGINQFARRVGGLFLQ